MLSARGSLSRRQDWLFSVFSLTINFILGSRVSSVHLLSSTGKKKKEKSHFYTPWKVLKSLWSLCYPWHCWHFISSRRCWAAGGYGWLSMRHLKLQRNDVTSSWFQTVVFTAMPGWEPGLEPGTLVASICCSCLLWQISSPARLVWLLQDLDFHFNNPKTSLNCAEELNLNM